MKWELAIKSNRRGKILGSSLILSLFLFFLLSSRPRLLLLDQDYKRLADFRPEDFSIIYTHSVERTDVRENYRIEAGKIILTETYFSSYGAGLPATTKDDFEITEDGFHIYNIDREFEEVIYRSGKKLANHRLLIGEKEYRLSDFNRPGQLIRFTVEKLPRWKTYLGGER